jgi:hypothetical protein
MAPPIDMDSMAKRTTSKIVTFTKPFVLADFDEVLPAGNYVVDTEENLIDGLSFAAYFRSTPTIYLPSASANPGLWRTMNVDPKELDMALTRDRESSPPTTASVHPTAASGMQRHSLDRLAIERAENEGMPSHAC